VTTRVDTPRAGGSPFADDAAHAAVPPRLPFGLQRWELLGVGSATALLAAVLCMWSVVTPAYRGPDEPQHLSTTLRLATGGGYPPFGKALMDPGVLSSFQWLDYRGRIGRTPRVERPPQLAQPPSMESLRSPDAPRPPTGGDQMTQHPPGYYALLAGAVNALGLNGASPESMVLVLRLLSLTLLLPIPILCVLVARRLGLPPPVRVVAAFFPAAWIEFTHLGATINNGTLLILASSLAVALLLPIAQGDARIHRALAAGAAISLALVTKGLALALLASLAVAYIGTVRVAGVRAAARSGACAALMVLPGLAWWIINFARYGQVQQSSTADLERTRDVATLAGWGKEFVDTFSWTLWGALGWAETRLPKEMHLTATALLVLLLLVGTWMIGRAGRRPIELLVLHSVWVGPLAIVAYGSARSFLVNGDVRAAQGRYVQMAVCAFAVLTVAALGRLRRSLTLAPAAAATVAGAGLLYGYRHFWAGSGGASRWDALTSWWPGATVLAVVAALLAVAGTAVGTVALARLTAQQPGTAP
jgi:hypothetical protein